MRIGIFGYGVEGRSTLEYLQRRGEKDIVVFDRIQPKDLPRGVGFSEEKDVVALCKCDVVFRTPGVSPLHPVLKEAQQQGVQITSQCKEFFSHVPCPVIGVTGTKGKGTTSTLIYEILRANGQDAYLAGNIGVPPLSLLERLQATSWVVLELSSFQLMDLEVSPHIAVLLNITEDHLDYHHSVEEYREAKTSIVRYQKESDVCVYNVDYPALQLISNRSSARKIPCSTRKVLSTGVSIVEGMSVIVTEQGDICSFLSTDMFALPGQFNHENIAPALAVAAELGLLTEQTKSVLSSFRGLPHRLELVGEVAGVQFYDDSFSTVPSTTLAALSAFPGSRKIVVLGGSSKGADFTVLVQSILQDTSVRGVILLGTEEALRIGKVLEEQNTVSSEQRMFVYENTSVSNDEDNLQIRFVREREQLEEALESLLSLTDVVLFSPACASFDIFRNYKERGEFFQKTVASLVQK